MADGAVRRADRQTTRVEHSTRAEAHFSSFVCDLVEGWEDVVRELDLSNRRPALCGHTDSEAYNALLAKWSVEHTRLAEAILKILGLGIWYFSDGFNRFDFLIVVLSMIELSMASGGNMAAFRAFRILRIFRVLRVVKLFKVRKLTAPRN